MPESRERLLLLAKAKAKASKAKRDRELEQSAQSQPTETTQPMQENTVPNLGWDGNVLASTDPRFMGEKVKQAVYGVGEKFQEATKYLGETNLLPSLSTIFAMKTGFRGGDVPSDKNSPDLNKLGAGVLGLGNVAARIAGIPFAPLQGTPADPIMELGMLPGKILAWGGKEILPEMSPEIQKEYDELAPVALSPLGWKGIAKVVKNIPEGATKLGKSFEKKALNPSFNANKGLKVSDRKVMTAFKDGIAPTRTGLTKITNTLSTLKTKAQEIIQPLAEQGTTIKFDKAREVLDKELRNSERSGADFKETIDAVNDVKERLVRMDEQYPNGIPIDIANEFKSSLEDKAFGKWDEALQKPSEKKIRLYEKASMAVLNAIVDKAPQMREIGLKQRDLIELKPEIESRVDVQEKTPFFNRQEAAKIGLATGVGYAIGNFPAAIAMYGLEKSFTTPSLLHKQAQFLKKIGNIAPKVEGGKLSPVPFRNTKSEWQYPSYPSYPPSQGEIPPTTPTNPFGGINVTEQGRKLQDAIIQASNDRFIKGVEKTPEQKTQSNNPFGRNIVENNAVQKFNKVSEGQVINEIQKQGGIAHIDDVIRSLGASAQEVMGHLTTAEIKGVINRKPEGIYELKSYPKPEEPSPQNARVKLQQNVNPLVDYKGLAEESGVTFEGIHTFPDGRKAPMFKTKTGHSFIKRADETIAQGRDRILKGIKNEGTQEIQRTKEEIAQKVAEEKAKRNVSRETKTSPVSETPNQPETPRLKDEGTIEPQRIKEEVKNTKLMDAIEMTKIGKETTESEFNSIMQKANEEFEKAKLYDANGNKFKYYEHKDKGNKLLETITQKPFQEIVEHEGFPIPKSVEKNETFCRKLSKEHRENYGGEYKEVDVLGENNSVVRHAIVEHKDLIDGNDYIFEPQTNSLYRKDLYEKYSKTIKRQ